MQLYVLSHFVTSIESEVHLRNCTVTIRENKQLNSIDLQAHSFPPSVVYLVHIVFSPLQRWAHMRIHP